MVDDGRRHVEFEACFNFRDIGGYETIDGRTVRWGAVFRSGSLHRLTAVDLERTARLGVRTVIDLRTAEELERDGRFARHHDVAFHHVPFEEPAHDLEAQHRALEAPPPGETYVTMATFGCNAVAAALRVIAEADQPVVVHCLAGKDRTGIVTALVLASLGVPDHAIAADYHLSERALGPSIAWAERNDAQWASVMAELPPWVLGAPPSAMEAFLGALRDRHGSIDGYLRDAGVGADVVDQLRARLLHP